MRHVLFSAAALTLIACSNGGAPASDTEENRVAAAETKLNAVLAAQADEEKARYQYRHPKETLGFFGIEPGMTVVDTLPGQVWYTGILSDYLGPDGKVIGADYSMEMWPLFGGFVTEEWLEKRRNWAATYVSDANANRDEDDAPVEAFVYGSLPEDMYGVADVVLMVRATHHFNRFEDEGGFYTQALQDAMNVLKPGGVLGVIQHRAPEENSDKWAEGDNGYVKQSHIISFVEDAGFEFLGSSEINANPNDQPTEDEFVWRLPPTLATSNDNPELRAQMEAIGESDRMTLKFRKPE